MNNNIKWICENDNVGIATICKIEEFFNVKFPKDYVEIVMENDGAYPIPNRFNINGSEEVFNNLLSFDENDSSYIVDVFNDVKDRLLDSIIPIAEDPFGNLICFDYRTNNQPSIVFWDHEKAFYDKNLAISDLCDSFNKLLFMLHEPSKIE